MPVYTIRHSPALHGEAQINTSKNAVLPILAAALLCSSPVTIHRAPRLTDVDHMLRVLTDCGARIERQDRDITIYPAALRQPREPQNLHSLRASILVLGPLCVRLGEAIVPLPGGCAIGQRPVDIHLNGLRAMGAETEQADNCAVARGRLRGANIYLDFPSVGATENLLMAAALADGVTRIENAAKEPEIVDLADFLNLAGAHIVGAGTGTLVIEGVSRLSGVEYTPIADRIEAGTLACAAAIIDCFMNVSDVKNSSICGRCCLSCARWACWCRRMRAVCACAARCAMGRISARCPIRGFPLICRPR